jgi:uncharacterized protein (TIGR03083 family)
VQHASTPATYDRSVEIARWYLDAQRSFVDLSAGFTDDDWATPVPCNPGWTVRDVLSHLAGLADDLTNGRVEGAATAPWTAAQVERWRDTDVGELIARWIEQAPGVGATIEAFAEFRPPIDCHTHEHDVRHALGRPGNRDSELIDVMAERFDHAPVGRPIEIEYDDAAVVTLSGEGRPLTLVGVSRFEIVRSRLGRRSRAQVLAYEWTESPTDDELAMWFAFGPSDVDIVE